MLRLSLTILEMILGAVPEGFLLIFACYVLSKTPINKKNWLVSGLTLGVSAYLIRLLPIHFGIHTLLLFMVYNFLSVWINNIDIMKSLSSSLIASIMLMVFEVVSIMVMTEVIHLDIDALFENSFVKVLFGIPHLLLFGAAIFLIYKIPKRHHSSRKESKNVFN